MIKRSRCPLAAAAVLLGGVLLFASALHAETPTAATSTAGEDPTAAKAHFKSGKAYYDLGKYDEAIREFEAAYEAKSDPAFLFNLAQAHRLAGHSTEALHFYRTYLRYVPNPPNLSDIEANMRTLERAVEKTAPSPVSPVPASGSAPTEPQAIAPQPVAAPPNASAPPVLSGAASDGPPPAKTSTASTASPPPQPPAVVSVPRNAALDEAGLESGTGPRKRLGKVLAIAGGSAIVVGMLFGLGARSASKSVESASVFDPSVEKRGQAFESLQWVGYILGGITAGVGGYLLATTSERALSSSLALVPLAGPHGGGASLRVSFR